MKDINWAEKLSSRKFWALICAFVTALLVLFRVGEETIVQVAALIGAVASVIVYILGEAWVDVSRVKSDTVIFNLDCGDDEPPDEEDAI